MQGRQVLSEEGLHTLPLHLRSGVYVVRAISGSVQESIQIIQLYMQAGQFRPWTAQALSLQVFPL